MEYFTVIKSNYKDYVATEKNAHGIMGGGESGDGAWAWAGMAAPNEMARPGGWG